MANQELAVLRGRQRAAEVRTKTNRDHQRPSFTRFIQPRLLSCATFVVNRATSSAVALIWTLCRLRLAPKSWLCAPVLPVVLGVPVRLARVPRTVNLRCPPRSIPVAMLWPWKSPTPLCNAHPVILVMILCRTVPTFHMLRRETFGSPTKDAIGLAACSGW